MYYRVNNKKKISTFSLLGLFMIFSMLMTSTVEAQALGDGQITETIAVASPDFKDTVSDGVVLMDENTPLSPESTDVSGQEVTPTDESITETPTLPGEEGTPGETQTAEGTQSGEETQSPDPRIQPRPTQPRPTQPRLKPSRLPKQLLQKKLRPRMDPRIAPVAASGPRMRPVNPRTSTNIHWARRSGSVPLDFGRTGIIAGPSKKQVLAIIW